jgi:hypothetical protein
MTGRRQIQPVALAFAISLALHVVLFGSLELNHRFQWWNKSSLVRWLKETLLKPATISPSETQKKPPSPDRQLPLQFVDVDPALATLEPPKEAQYYSALSSSAANPKPTVESNVPKIDGQQTKIAKTFDTLHIPTTPPQPQPPPVEKKPEKKVVETKSEPATSSPPGDSPQSKPELKPPAEKVKPENDAVGPTSTPIPTPTPPPRARTLAEARQRKGIVVAPKMKQEGGIRKIGPEMLDVRGTRFGAYDAAIVAAVQQHWYDLLAERKFAGEGMGKVVLEFHLNSNGKITEMKTTNTEVGAVLAVICQRAVLDPSPYAEWPSDMRREIGRNYREVRFTFYY